VTSILSSELRLTEIFYSLQGEARSVGVPTVFVRLTGCPLRCQYCDTTYSFTGGEKYSLEQILPKSPVMAHVMCVSQVANPSLNPIAYYYYTALCDAGYQVSLETSGALDVSQVDVRVSKVLDLKTPDSGESHRNLYDNVPYLTLMTKSNLSFVANVTMTGRVLNLTNIN
jgi:7-carboxy-7-deazaguanine synthase